MSITIILTIIQAALAGLSNISSIGGDVKLAGAFVSILQGGLQAYELQAGQPLDLTKIPLESLIPTGQPPKSPAPA